MAEGQLYFLKLKRNFFKRHDVRIIRKECGNDGLIMYLCLLCESLDHEGKLRFSDSEPYSIEDLAILADIESETAEKTMQFLKRRGMVTVENDGTIIMDRLDDFIAPDTGAERSRRYRERRKAEKNETEASRDRDDTDTQPTRDRNDTATTPRESIEYRVQSIEYRDNNTHMRTDGARESVPAAENDASEVVDLIDRDFEEAWTLYPKKRDKKKAKAAYVKARKNGVPHSVIMDGIRRYIEYIRIEKYEPRYIKNGATWFNGACWEDDDSVHRKPTTKDLARNYSWDDWKDMHNFKKEAQ